MPASNRSLVRGRRALWIAAGRLSRRSLLLGVLLAIAAGEIAQAQLSGQPDSSKPALQFPAPPKLSTAKGPVLVDDLAQVPEVAFGMWSPNSSGGGFSGKAIR